MGQLDHLDPEIVADFLTESGELIDNLDQDLVDLEQSPQDPDLINRVFRAMHTIKGSASFLGLTGLTDFAHAAEDCLNVVRKGEANITQEVMDHLLAAVDVLRKQLDTVGNGAMPEPGPADLAAALRAVGSGTSSDANSAAASDEAESGEGEALELAESKRDLLPFMVDDLVQSLGHLGESLAHVNPDANLGELAVEMRELTSEMVRSVEFFEIDALSREVTALDRLAGWLPTAQPEQLVQGCPRAQALMAVINRRAEALANMRLVPVNTDTLLERLEALLSGQPIDEAAQLPEGAGTEQVWITDQVIGMTETTEAEEQEAPAGSSPTEGGGSVRESGEKGESGERADSGEATIRVQVSRLESLLNLIGELVLQKNRVLGMHRRLREEQVDHDLTEEFEQVASDLERVTGDLQLSVMKTRLQPLSKLFSRYPRVIRDLARMTNKQINLVMEGGETEVDKSVLEGLGDPLVHLLRNSADHGVETPEIRKAAGKPETGTIRLSARHEGNYVLITIIDDGRGIDRQSIGRKAIEKGVISEDELAAMPDGNVLQLIFAPGFSTAEQVSDLSGRGVGMDVVRTNIAKLNGMVDVDSTVGQGTTVSIKIPLTVAIMPAMMVGVSGELYAVPLTNVREIVRPEKSNLHTIRGQLVMRLRDRVLPLVDLGGRFGISDEAGKFAVVVGLAEQTVGLLVDRLLGQQEIVIKPLDDMFDKNGDVSGATVREDGGVSLILDIGAMLKSLNQGKAMAA
jgi:two-component system chemotaxis sensor kinase CheA